MRKVLVGKLGSLASELEPPAPTKRPALLARVCGPLAIANRTSGPHHRPPRSRHGAAPSTTTLAPAGRTIDHHARTTGPLHRPPRSRHGAAPSTTTLAPRGRTIDHHARTSGPQHRPPRSHQRAAASTTTLASRSHHRPPHPERRNPDRGNQHHPEHGNPERGNRSRLGRSWKRAAATARCVETREARGCPRAWKPRVSKVGRQADRASCAIL